MIGIAASHRGLKANGRYGSKADVWTSLIDVRFTPKSGHRFCCDSRRSMGENLSPLKPRNGQRLSNSRVSRRRSNKGRDQILHGGLMLAGAKSPAKPQWLKARR